MRLLTLGAPRCHTPPRLNATLCCMEASIKGTLELILQDGLALLHAPSLPMLPVSKRGHPRHSAAPHCVAYRSTRRNIEIRLVPEAGRPPLPRSHVLASKHRRDFTLEAGCGTLAVSLLPHYYYPRPNESQRSTLPGPPFGVSSGRGLVVSRLLKVLAVSKAGLGSPIRCARARFRAKVDGFVPRTRTVNLRLVGSPEPGVRPACRLNATRPTAQRATPRGVMGPHEERLLEV